MVMFLDGVEGELHDTWPGQVPVWCLSEISKMRHSASSRMTLISVPSS